MASTAASAGQNISDYTIDIAEEIHVAAPIQITFDSLLEQLGPEQTAGSGVAMPMKIEAWPGGRWWRDLGDGNGHYWGTVQAIKRPTLLEICGPLMVSSPLTSNVQYRLSEEPGGTLIKFHHKAFGLVPENFKTGVNQGWKGINERVRKAAEGKGSK